MKALNNMHNRLDYNGGTAQQSRMIEDKLNSLKKALLYSYQAGVMIIDNPDKDSELETLEFRCLMNPDKRTFDADKMMLSVPYEDICLNVPVANPAREGTIKNPVKCGSVFQWKETNTRWIVTLQYIEEYAYFRADVRKCFEFPININSKEYWFSSVGENEETLNWDRRNREEWNKINYTRAIYIERNDETIEYFKRFKIVNLPNISGELEPWEVQAVKPNSVDDILIVYLKEYFINRYEEESQKAQEEEQEQHEINKDLVVHVYDKFKVHADYIEGASWEIINKSEGLKLKIEDAIISEDNITVATIQLLNGKTGEFDIRYGEVIQHVVVKSL